MNRTRELIQMYLDEDATAEELAELEETLRRSPAAARHFADACRIDAFLADHFGERQREAEVAALFERDRPRPTPRKRRRLRVPWVAVAAVLVLALGAVLLYPVVTGRSGRAHAVVLSGRVDVDGVARERLPRHARLVVPATGPAAIRLADGSRVELGASSEMVLHDPKGEARQVVELVDGSGRFEVAAGRGAFRVETALGSVTALGTAFTVELWSVDGPGGSGKAVRALAVAVTRGRVRVDAGAASRVLAEGQRWASRSGVVDGGVCAPAKAAGPVQRPDAKEAPSLPLPATPSRRTEAKPSPEPPTVIVKLTATDPADWATDPDDIRNLLAWMGQRLDVAFGYQEKALADVQLDAERLPVLYRTGHHAFRFTDAERQRLRAYVLGGGLLVFDACCGREAFADSVRREMAAIFPERPLRKLPADHPLYHACYDVAEVAYTPATGIEGVAPPPLEGIEIGCRAGVVFSPVDLSCGWALHEHKDGRGVRCEDALKLGANLVAYAVATRSMGASLAESRKYVDPERALADKFRIGHVVHGGQWNPDPAGLANLLDTVRSSTSLKVSFATEALRLDSPELTRFPFLYMTGHGDFRLSDGEAAALRAYLKAGGFLLADACCGREAFDAAFRREMARVLPDHRLARLSPRHRLYSIHHRIRTVGLTKAAVARLGAEPLGAPSLEGITVDGQLAVVYSPLDLGCGWELKPHPYGVGYAWRDAIRLGVNVVVYAVSH